MTTTISRKGVSAHGQPYYPDSDEEPMAETNLHWEATVYCKESLQLHYALRDDVYVASDNFLYFVEGQPRSVVSPDCYVVFGVARGLRDTYKTWEENGRTPDVVIELTSKKTRKEDTGRKFEIYQDILRVAEYFLFDPTADYIRTRLTGYRLQEDGYVPITPDANGRLYSEQMGLVLFVEGDRLRILDPRSGKVFMTDLETRIHAEQEARRARQQQERAEREAQRANAAEAEIARLRAELEALRR